MNKATNRMFAAAVVVACAVFATGCVTQRPPLLKQDSPHGTWVYQPRPYSEIYAEQAYGGLVAGPLGIPENCRKGAEGRFLLPLLSPVFIVYL